ncbi:hypothetical protein FZW96_03355 [Bacillus sp. BGMRC 2118]|nr:hypothetical protein FZW96_03355 [Bacillus sp. BGMRC 2118]
MNKKIVVLFGILFVLLVSIAAYFFYYTGASQPAAFPNHHSILTGINELQSEIQAETVQDTIFLTDRDVFVPFISNEGTYGSSYWTWKRGKWRIAHIEENVDLRIWKVNPNDPSTFHFVWNLPPNDEVHHVSLYLTKS